jgi:linoleoyl-CoA desaturase
VFGCYFLASLLEGVVLSVVFQLAHCVEGAEFPAPAAVGAPIATPWLSHQLATTVDFSRSNPLLGWLLGGLNYQVEHHLFPQISHVHYAALSPIVERTCREFGVPFRDHGSLLNGVVAHYRWLRRMGRPPVAPG